MNDQINITDGEIDALLVFLANDTLEGAEREMVQAAVDGNSALQAQLKTLKMMRSEMQARPVNTNNAGELSLARIIRDIDKTSVVHPQRLGAKILEDNCCSRHGSLCCPNYCCDDCA